MAELMVEITYRNFDQLVLSNPQPVLLDFWAPWSSECVSMGPVISDVALDFYKKVTFAKCNVDCFPRIAERYDIQSVPTTILIRNGTPVETIFGPTTRQRLADSLGKLFADGSDAQ